MQKIAKSLKSAHAWSRSLSCRIVLKLHFQLFNNVDRFSQWVAISQEDMSKQKRLTGGMQRAGCRTVVFYQQNKGSVWLNLLNWSEPQKKNNDYYDINYDNPLKTIIKLTCVGPDGLTLGRDELRSSINHEFYVVTQKNNHKVILDMWFEFVVGSCRCSESFSLGPPVFLPLQEQTFLIPMETVERRATTWNECLLLKWLLLIPLSSNSLKA